MTTQTVSRLLGVPVRDILALIHAGKLPAVKIGGRWKIFDEDFQRWEGRSMKRAIPYTAAIAEQKPAGQIKMPEPAPKLDLDDVVARLLPFEDDQDEIQVYPICRYRIDPLDHDDMFGVVGYAVYGCGVMCNADHQTREQAIEFCRADLKIRLRAVLDLVEG